MWEEVSDHVEGSDRCLYLYVRSIDFPSFYDFDILFWNCSDSVVFFYISVILLKLC